MRALVERTREALARASHWELILVDDGSRDRTVEVAREMSRGDGRVRVVRLSRNFGQTAAMQAGFDAARGGVVVSMDGDLQNDPRDIPALVARLEEGYDLVAGYRVRRQDTWTRRFPSWVANRMIRWVTGVDIRDNGCSLKVYSRELLDRVRLYSDMHRFIPAVAVGIAGARVTEMAVRHHPRQAGQSKYGPSRILKVLADIVTIKMIRSFKDRPLRLFGVLAVGAGVVAVGFLLSSGAAMLWFQPQKARAIVFPTAGILWAGVALYLLMLGLVGEALVRRHHKGLGARLPLVRDWPAPVHEAEEGL